MSHQEMSATLYTVLRQSCLAACVCWLRRSRSEPLARAKSSRTCWWPA